MTRRIPMFSLCLVSVVLAALHAEPAAAQTGSSCQDVQLYVGEMFGDRLMETPDYSLASHKFSAYTEAGMDSAWAHLDHDLFGFAGDWPVTITDSNGYTANAGLGAMYYLWDNFFVGFGARYRYLSKLTSACVQGLNSAQTTLSLRYQF
jgi:opacity protein-like surface antigen